MFKAGDPRVAVMPEAFAIPRLAGELVPALPPERSTRPTSPALVGNIAALALPLPIPRKFEAYYHLLPNRLISFTYIVREEKKERKKERKKEEASGFKKRKLSLQMLNNWGQEGNLFDHLVIEQTTLLNH
jgi:hypothetical protein